MANHDETKAKDIAHKVKSHVANATKESMSDIEDIKDDLESLKGNVVGLAHNVRSASVETARDAVQYVQNRAETMATSIKSASADTIKQMEKQIKTQPGRSVGLAFVSGLVISYLFRRRPS